jgi:peptidoglycan/LPS O-acetylase OafA/YrhL
VGEIKPLTGLRFVAAFGVLTGHMTMTSHGGFGSFHAPWKSTPSMTLFFCLSGFVLTWTYRARFRPGPFLWARFARIYPLFAFVFAIEALVNGLPRGDFWNHALLLQAWTRDTGFFSVSWSLSAEAFFYASFPLLAYVLVRLDRRQLCWAATIAVVASVAISLEAYVGAVSYDWARVVPLARLPDFVFGCIVARLALGGFEAPAWATGALVAIIGGLMWAPVPAPFNRDALFLAPLGLLLLCLATRDSRPGRLLGHPVMLRLGTASFALYLIHPLVRESAWFYFGSELSPAAVMAAVSASIAASFVLYTYIEEPARRTLRSRSVRESQVGQPEMVHRLSPVAVHDPPASRAAVSSTET